MQGRAILVTKRPGFEEKLLSETRGMRAQSENMVVNTKPTHTVCANTLPSSIQFVCVAGNTSTISVTHFSDILFVPLTFRQWRYIN